MLARSRLRRARAPMTGFWRQRAGLFTCHHVLAPFVFCTLAGGPTSNRIFGLGPTGSSRSYVGARQDDFLPSSGETGAATDLPRGQSFLLCCSSGHDLSLPASLFLLNALRLLQVWK